MSCSRTSRLASLLILLSVSVVPSGCQDELADPTRAQVRLSFRPAGLATGSQVWIDETLVTDSLSVGSIDTLLEAGPHRFVVHPNCALVAPDDTLTLDIAGGRDQDVEFSFTEASAILAVRSSPSGLPIWIDGVETGRTTPDSILCLEEGSYAVEVRPSELGSLGFSISGDSTETVQLGTSGVSTVDFDFSFEPIPQEQGVLLELFTATYCSPCKEADHAAEDLENDATYDPEMLSAVQIHISWGGADVLNNDQLSSRGAYYGLGGSDAPNAYFNGLDRVQGAPNYETVLAAYRSRIDAKYGQPSDAALYWTDVGIEGDLLRGNLRFVAVRDLSGFDQPVLQAFYAKDSVWAQNPFNVDFFTGVVREYLAESVDLHEAQAVTPGAVLDMEIAFDLSLDVLDREDDHAEWLSNSARLVAFVQDRTTREIIQTRTYRLRIP